MVPTIFYISADDWCAVYVNGSLYFEGHSVPDSVYWDLLAEGPFVVDSSFSESDFAYWVVESLDGFPGTLAEFLTLELEFIELEERFG